MLRRFYTSLRSAWTSSQQGTTSSASRKAERLYERLYDEPLADTPSLTYCLSSSVGEQPWRTTVPTTLTIH
ncbi:hypothetical protein KIN20_021164 [Parelaphostrongylus tenuis]|uniref:Uncharacterized protein n=1 Tax=Parelaphostrongylus tenuis TaxID=148309 RepID=A0AAD5NAI7_PARTN|nr:hypothetical protein KIN20_021164 [Parelaphostrongylus tenuis]